MGLAESRRGFVAFPAALGNTAWVTNPQGERSQRQRDLRIVVSISPKSKVLLINGSEKFTATVKNDLQNKGVTWTLSGAGCAGASCGTLSSASSASGTAITYTAPATAPNPATVTLTATSATDSIGERNDHHRFAHVVSGFPQGAIVSQVNYAVQRVRFHVRMNDATSASPQRLRRCERQRGIASGG